MSALTLTTAAHIARVTLNRPEVRNAFNEALIAELTETFHTLGRYPHLRAIILPREKPFAPAPTSIG